MKFKFIILMTFLLHSGVCFCENGVDGGGDPFLIKLYRLKSEAVARLQTIDQRWIFSGENDILDFLLAQNKLKEIAADLKDSVIDLRPNETDATPNPNGKCAITKQEKNAPIYFTKDQCKDATDEQLIDSFYNEAVHHSGKDNSFAARSANAIHNAYFKGPPIFGNWETIINGQKISIWLGSEFKDDTMRIGIVTDYIKGLYLDVYATAFDLKTGELKVEGGTINQQFDGRFCRFPFNVSVRFINDYQFLYFNFNVLASSDSNCQYSGISAAYFQLNRDGKRPIQSYLQNKSKVPTYYLNESKRFISKYINSNN